MKGHSAMEHDQLATVMAGLRKVVQMHGAATPLPWHALSLARKRKHDAMNDATRSSQLPD